MKTEPTLLFGTRKLASGALGIYQDPYNMNLMTRMIGYNKNEKMNMMGVQTLVGLARYKSILANSKFELDEKNNIKAIRTELGLSQSQLAEMVGVSRNTISSIETGQFSPTAKLALVICIALEKKFEDLFFF